MFGVQLKDWASFKRAGLLFSASFVAIGALLLAIASTAPEPQEKPIPSVAEATRQYEEALKNRGISPAHEKWLYRAEHQLVLAKIKEAEQCKDEQ